MVMILSAVVENLANYFNIFALFSLQQQSMLKLAQTRLDSLLEVMKERPKATLAISLSLFVGLVIRRYQKKLVYMPVLFGMSKSPKYNPYPYQHPSQFKMESDNVQIITKDGVKLKGWHMKAQNPRRLILYYHENAGNIGTRLSFCRYVMSQTQSDILLIAYRGYSDSQGSPTEEGLKKDSLAILDKAKELARERNVEIVVFGRSLGGAAAIYACTHENNASKVKGVILENTFTSIRDVVIHMLPRSLTLIVKIVLWFLLTNKWNSYQLIPKIRKPVLFIKSAKDQLIPKAQMDKLQSKCEVRHYQYVIHEGTHNQSWTKDPHYFREVNLFLSKL